MKQAYTYENPHELPKPLYDFGLALCNAARGRLCVMAITVEGKRIAFYMHYFDQGIVLVFDGGMREWTPDEITGFAAWCDTEYTRLEAEHTERMYRQLKEQQDAYRKGLEYVWHDRGKTSFGTTPLIYSIQPKTIQQGWNHE